MSGRPSGTAASRRRSSRRSSDSAPGDRATWRLGLLAPRSQPAATIRPQQESRARHAVIEAKAVHPAFIDQVMHRGPVVGIRSLRQRREDLAHRTHAREVAEHDRRPRRRSLQPGRNRQLPREKSAGPRRVDDEVGVEARTIASPRSTQPGTRSRRSRDPSTPRDRGSPRPRRSPRGRSDDRRPRAASACRPSHRWDSPRRAAARTQAASANELAPG